MGLFSRRPNERRAANLPDGPLRRFAEVTTPSPDTPASKLRLLAVDVETTGLDAKKDSWLSIGFVPVDGDAIILAGAGNVVLRGAPEVGGSAVFHGLTDDQIAAGVAPEKGLAQLLDALQGRVLLAHHAVIESDFLRTAMRRTWGVDVPIVTVDTLRLQHGLLTKGFDDEPPRGALRLWAARDRYGLPRYRAHEALTDALACAELYLAQVSELGWDTPLKKLR